jgi:formate dehydrogenase accessory protein FdhE
MIRVHIESCAEAFAARAARALELAATSRVAQEPLRFAAGLLEVQGAVAQALDASHRKRPLAGRFADDCERVLAHGFDVVQYAAKSGPPALAEDAGTHTIESLEETCARHCVARAADDARYNSPATPADYLARAILRPWFEVLRERGVAPERVHGPGSCPFCGGVPSVGCRRGASESDGAARSLVCASCGLEWRIGRVRCATCLESDASRLPAFTDPNHPGVRIEACESCRRYVKSIDVANDPRCAPEVDELRSLALDLWAQESGYSRPQPGLAGF